MKRPPPFTLKAGPAETGMRLDRLLRRLLPDIPLSGIHRMIRKGGALVDGRRVKGSHRLSEGEEVSLALDEREVARLGERLIPRTDAPSRGAADPIPDIPVLYDDGHVLAFDKPSGVAAHPGSGHAPEATVLGALGARLGHGSGAFTPALVGRLDRDTSGVQLAGTSPEGLRGLSALSRSGAIAKAYLALVRDGGLPGKGQIEAKLLDAGRGRARMRVVREGCDSGGAIEALTEYRVVSRGGGACLVEVRPRTGRRHQIRAHFRHLGAPLAGDVRYGDAGWNRRLAAEAGLRRLFLHCTEARFVHPVTEEDLCIRSALPEELAAALERLGLSP